MASASAASRTSLATARNASAKIQVDGARWSASKRLRSPHDHRDGQPDGASTACSAQPRSCCGERSPRRSTVRAPHAFGKPLIEQPLMQNGAGSVRGDRRPRALSRMSLAYAPRRGRDRVPAACDPGGEVLGVKVTPCGCRRGLGMHRRRRLHRGLLAPRPYRESPLNSIWEGAGNIQALARGARWPSCRSRWMRCRRGRLGLRAGHAPANAADGERWRALAALAGGSLRWPARSGRLHRPPAAARLTGTLPGRCGLRRGHRPPRRAHLS